MVRPPQNIVRRSITPLLLLGSMFAQSTMAHGACDEKRGKSLFSKCTICHSSAKDAGHQVGPNLYAVVNRNVGAASDFIYTDELKAYGEKWTLELLDKFLSSPMSEVPGTTMAFAGFKKEVDRRNLLCYLSTLE